jgi:processive 1,2-diacylglycerol beta-glucosyltransferase
MPSQHSTLYKKGNHGEINFEKEFSMKKKILIMSCKGGGGHMSAAHAIESYLKEKHDIEIVDMMGDKLVHIDPFYYLSFKHCAGQNIYNFLLRHNKKRLTNLYSQLGIFMIFIAQKLIKRGLRSLLKKEKPDIVISVIPYLNNFIADVAQELNVSFLLVPTDLDASTFIKNVSLIKKKNAITNISFAYPELAQKINNNMIPETKLKALGFPICPAFFAKKNTNQIKKQLNLSEYKPTILLIMGATGSNAILYYLQILSFVEVPFNLIACTGRSKSLHKAINKISLNNPLITLCIVNNTVEMSDLMAVADVCITKPGSVTFAETLYMNLPVILDNTSTALIWEELNLTFLKNYALGDVITDYNQVVPLITRYLTDIDYRNNIKKNIEALDKKHFGDELKLFINEF